MTPLVRGNAGDGNGGGKTIAAAATATSGNSDLDHKLLSSYNVKGDIANGCDCRCGDVVTCCRLVGHFCVR